MPCFACVFLLFAPIIQILLAKCLADALRATAENSKTKAPPPPPTDPLPRSSAPVSAKMMKSWADLVDEDSNELTFLNQPPNFAREFDPLLDDSSKLGLNKEFASSVVLHEASQHAAIEQDNANHAHSVQPPPATPADSEQAKPLNFSGLIKPSEPAQRQGSPSPAAKTYANVARSALPEHGIATNASVQIFDNPLSSDAANSAPANVSTLTPQDSPSKRTAKAETPKSHKIAHSKTRTPGSSPYRSKRETDPHRISQREKQLSMGKNTVGYQLYTAAIARCVCSFFFFSFC
jgi:hypothetical protein